jgi:hypothetical protein
MATDKTQNASSKRVVEARDAVAAAMEFVKSVAGVVANDTDIAVEEIDFDPQAGDWLITLGNSRYVAPFAGGPESSRCPANGQGRTHL